MSQLCTSLIFKGCHSCLTVLNQGYRGVSGSIRNQDQGWGYQGPLISGSQAPLGTQGAGPPRPGSSRRSGPVGPSRARGRALTLADAEGRGIEEATNNERMSFSACGCIRSAGRTDTVAHRFSERSCFGRPGALSSRVTDSRACRPLHWSAAVGDPEMLLDLTVGTCAGSSRSPRDPRSAGRRR